ncbi:MAG: hypothetical protein QM756_18815 [Polyangiaceae bacterium]
MHCPDAPRCSRIELKGHIPLSALEGAYGQSLKNHLAAAPTQLALLFSALELTGVELSLPTAHAALLQPYMNRILAVATISERAFVRFGMAAASMVLTRKFLTFDSRDAADAWLRSFQSTTQVARR